MELRLSHGYVVLLTWVELGADELEEERLADEVGEVVDAAGGVDDADGRLHGHRGGHRQRPVHRHGRRHAGGLLDGAAPRRREPTGALLPARRLAAAAAGCYSTPPRGGGRRRREERRADDDGARVLRRGQRQRLVGVNHGGERLIGRRRSCSTARRPPAGRSLNDMIRSDLRRLWCGALVNI